MKKYLLDELEANNYENYTLSINSVDDLEDCGQSLKQELLNFDEYYRNRVREQRMQMLAQLTYGTNPNKIEELNAMIEYLGNDNKYLPSNWSTTFSDLDYKISEMKFRKESSNMEDKDNTFYQQSYDIDDLDNLFADDSFDMEGYNVYGEGVVKKFENFLND